MSDQTHVTKTSSEQPRLSVVIPTCGRSSLSQTLSSLSNQDHQGVEVIVVGDGFQPNAKITTEVWSDQLDIRYVSHGPTRNFGNSQREFAYRICHGDYIVHMDDDDIFTPEAIKVIRKGIVATRLSLPSQTPVFNFKVIAPWRETVWFVPDLIEQGNCCTIQMVIPNDRGCLPRWPGRQGGNIPFLKELRRHYDLIWRPEIIAICRPYKEDLWW